MPPGPCTGLAILALADRACRFDTEALHVLQVMATRSMSVESFAHVRMAACAWVIIDCNGEHAPSSWVKLPGLAQSLA